MSDDFVEMLFGLGCVAALPLIGLYLLIIWGLFIVEPRTAFVLLRWGRHFRTIDRPGISLAFPIGLSWRKVSLRDTIFQIPLTTVVDTHGNPIEVSAVCVYRVIDPAKAVLEVQNYRDFVATQATTVLKAVCSRYPYETHQPHEPCLKKESDVISEALRTQLQKQALEAGVSVLLVRLNDLAYAPEIAQAMLLRQQAQSLVDARRILVEGAVSTVREGLGRLDQAQVTLSPTRRHHLITNLTLLLCAGERGEAHSTVVSRQR